MISDYDESLVPEEQWWAVVRGLGIEEDLPGDKGAEAEITAAANSSPRPLSPVQLPNAGAPLAAALPIPNAPSPLPIPNAGTLITDHPIPQSRSPPPTPVITADAIGDSMAVDEEMATAPAPSPSHVSDSDSEGDILDLTSPPSPSVQSCYSSPFLTLF
jgi:hypothetical protein